jgi:2-aminobenzoylacetyl-CoA thioesterase
MRIDISGYIANDLYVVGPPGMPVYLVDGAMPVLFDAGMTVFAETYVKEIRAVLGMRAPVYLFLTHVHFDHVGAAAYFKKTWPELKIVAAERSREILERPGAIQLIKTLNAGGVSMARQEGFSPLYEQPFERVVIDIAATPDMCFSMGSAMTVQALHVPGHTRDFMSYWIETKKILIASEAAGCDNGTGYVQPEFLVDYNGYMDNLARLSRLGADILCPGHNLVLTGEDAGDHLRRSAEHARRYVAMVRALLQEFQGNVDRVTACVKAEEWDPLPGPKQPEQAYLLNTRQRVAVVWQAMNAAHG